MAAGSYFLSSNWLFEQIGHWASAQRRIEPVDAIVVLGGGGAERLSHGISLYRQGLGRELWLTGNRELETQTHSGAAGMDEQAMNESVPQSAIRLLPTSSTWEDARESRKTMQSLGYNRLLIVTSWYHGRRALRTMEREFNGVSMKLFFAPVPSRHFSAENWWKNPGGKRVMKSEILKSVFYACRYGVKPW